PQFSTTTSGSSLADWQRAAARCGLRAPSTAVCCYPAEPGFVTAVAEAIRPVLAEAAGQGRPRVLFSAHGLPKRIVERGDPYQWQVERSAAAVAEALGDPDLDWRVCYQSKVGPLEWIGPATDDEIRRAGSEGVPLVVVPIAFVSEHSETLVELDEEYGRLAEASGVPGYHRVPTVGTAGDFIAGLAALVERAAKDRGDILAGEDDGGRLCPARCGRCPRDGAPAAGKA
ncbi:MAG TPA: ferrochelatase, partial [Kiloniellales bacterium]|nr:ferrochelatase [Kiloniellales bacterium]